MMRDVHWCVTVFYQQIENGNIANQIHGFTIDYSKFILIVIVPNKLCETQHPALLYYHIYANFFMVDMCVSPLKAYLQPVYDKQQN